MGKNLLVALHEYEVQSWAPHSIANKSSRRHPSASFHLTAGPLSLPTETQKYISYKS